MADDARITIRMGTEDVQAIDDYLADHPEFDDNRSLFIKNMLREYFDRDAEVVAEKFTPQSVAERDVCIDLPGTEKAEIRLSMSRRFAETLREGVRSGEYDNEGEFVRAVLRERFTTTIASIERSKLAFEKLDVNTYQQ